MFFLVIACENYENLFHFLIKQYKLTLAYLVIKESISKLINFKFTFSRLTCKFKQEISIHFNDYFYSSY